MAFAEAAFLEMPRDAAEEKRFAGEAWETAGFTEFVTAELLEGSAHFTVGTAGACA